MGLAGGHSDTSHHGAQLITLRHGGGSPAPGGRAHNKLSPQRPPGLTHKPSTALQAGHSKNPDTIVL